MRPIVVAILMAALLAACSAAPAASPSPPALVSGTPDPQPSSGPSPSAPTVGPQPSGAWSSVAWHRAGSLPFRPADATIQGWTGGFVAFEQSGGTDEMGEPTPVVIRVAASADGESWSSPTTIETGFGGSIYLSSIVEGPTGLLAQAFLNPGDCGGPPTLFALWDSADGRSWHRVAMPDDFTSGHVETIAGGPAGFIALGTRADGRTRAIWTSGDGRAWTSRALPAVAGGTLALDGVASFDGGFVLVGSVLGEGGCGGPAHVEYATWFSADGTAWTRTLLPGAAPDPNAELDVRRLGRSLLVIQSTQTGDPASGWASTDGQAWTAIREIPTEPFLSTGHEAVMLLPPDGGIGPVSVSVAGLDGTFLPIAQSGDVPSADVEGWGWQAALGPTGILFSWNDDVSLYHAVPR